jgi:hypothetical protein
MAEALIHVLESVKIHSQHGALAAAAVPSPELLSESGIQQKTVWEIGQIIMRGEIVYASLSALAFG